MSKEKSKKKGGGVIIFVILLLIILAVLAFLFGNGMLGFGGNSDGGIMPAIGTVSPEAETVSDDTPAETNYIDVTVSEDKYLYNNDTVTIDELIEKIGSFEKECEVHITVSDTATLNAVDDLKAAFDNSGIAYMIIESAEAE
ncbi:MAG: hypothetical protein J1F11_08045 [Oscillospiraceae bacterium]|nr:hypothetical protein [Oscillospiraceae bacterium]